MVISAIFCICFLRHLYQHRISIHHHAYVIQNPAPGLQVFQTPVPYAETDPDFHLCPLPRYTRKDYATNMHAATQRRYLDREVSAMAISLMIVRRFQVNV